MFRLPALLWWMVASASLTAQVPLTVSVPNAQDCRVTAAATPSELQLTLALADGFHAYTEDTGGGGPVTISLDPACGYEAAGALQVPENDAGQVSGVATWRLPIRPTGGPSELRATVWLQVCDELLCHAPERVELSGDPVGFSVLLVTGERGERAARLAAFLAARGMQVTTATYADVTGPMCDLYAVVLCDSKRFRQTAKVRELVRAFPKTETPIVAVGFFGTELIEAHGVAMTSGYI